MANRYNESQLIYCIKSVGPEFNSTFREIKEKYLMGNQQWIHESIKSLKRLLQSDELEPMAKLYLVKVIKQCFDTGFYPLVTLIEVELLPIFKNIAEYKKASTDHGRGKGFFLERIKPTDAKHKQKLEKEGNSFFRFVLECVQFWSDVKPCFCLNDVEVVELPSAFRETYSNLKNTVKVTFNDAKSYIKEGDVNKIKKIFNDRLNDVFDEVSNYVDFYSMILVDSLDSLDEFNSQDMNVLRRLLKSPDIFLVEETVKILRDNLESKASAIVKIQSLRFLNEMFKEGIVHVVHQTEQLTPHLENLIINIDTKSTLLKRGQKYIENDPKMSQQFYIELLKSIVLWSDAVPKDTLRPGIDSRFRTSLHRLRERHKIEFPPVSEEQIKSFRNTYLSNSKKHAIINRYLVQNLSMDIRSNASGAVSQRSNLPIQSMIPQLLPEVSNFSQPSALIPPLPKAARKAPEIPKNIHEQNIKNRFKTLQSMYDWLRECNSSSQIDDRATIQSCLSYMDLYNKTYEEYMEANIEMSEFQERFDKGYNYSEANSKIISIFNKSQLNYAQQLQEVKKAINALRTVETPGIPEVNEKDEEFKRITPISSQLRLSQDQASQLKKQEKIEEQRKKAELEKLQEAKRKAEQNRRMAEELQNKKREAQEQERRKQELRLKEEKKKQQSRLKEEEQLRQRMKEQQRVRQQLALKQEQKLKEERMKEQQRLKQQQRMREEKARQQQRLKQQQRQKQQQKLKEQRLKEQQKLRQQQRQREERLKEEQLRIEQQRQLENQRYQDELRQRQEQRIRDEQKQRQVEQAMRIKQHEQKLYEEQKGKSNTSDSKPIDSHKDLFPKPVMKPNDQDGWRKKENKPTFDSVPSQLNFQPDTRLDPNEENIVVSDDQVSEWPVVNDLQIHTKQGLLSGMRKLPRVASPIQQLNKLNDSGSVKERAMTPPMLNPPISPILVNINAPQNVGYFPEPYEEISQILEPALDPLNDSYHAGQAQQKLKNLLQSERVVPSFKNCFEFDKFLIPNKTITGKQKVFWLEQDTQVLNPLARSRAESVKSKTAHNFYQPSNHSTSMTLPELLAERSQKFDGQLRIVKQKHKKEVSLLEDKIKKLQQQLRQKNKVVNEQQKEIASLKDSGVGSRSMMSNGFNSIKPQQAQYITEENQLLKSRLKKNSSASSARYEPSWSRTQPIAMSPASPGRDTILSFRRYKEPKGRIFFEEPYTSFLSDLREVKSKKVMLKAKDLLLQSDILEIGTITSLEKSLRVALYIQSQSAISNLQYRLSNDIPYSAVPQKLPQLIEKGKQQRLVLAFQIPQVPYNIPWMEIYYRVNGNNYSNRILVPCTFNKFVNFQDITVEEFKNIFKSVKQQNIIRGNQIQFSRKLIREPHNITQYVPKCKPLNPHKQRQYEEGTTGLKFGVMAVYIQQKYLLKFHLRVNQTMVIQGTSLGGESKALEFLIATFNQLLAKETI